MEKVTIKNCVFAEDVVITTYPQWSDYGCLTNALKVVYEDGESYTEKTYVTEDLTDLECYDVEIESWGDVQKYKRYCNMKDSKEMESDNFRVFLNIKNGRYDSIRVRVVKGRKYPKGLEFNATKATSYDIPGTYGHQTIWYLDGMDDDGNRIHIDHNNIEFVSIND